MSPTIKEILENLEMRFDDGIMNDQIKDELSEVVESILDKYVHLEDDELSCMYDLFHDDKTHYFYQLLNTAQTTVDELGSVFE